MKLEIVLVFLAIAAAAHGAKSKSQSSSSNIVTGSVPQSGGYSQPIPSSYAAPVMSHPHPQHHVPRHDMYSYPQPMAAGSSQTEYYQPLDSGAGGQGAYSGYVNGGGQGGYSRHQQQGYYAEPVPQGSGHHPHHPIKRGHGWGSPGYGHESAAFLIIPLILIPLLLCWPYFLYAASHHHHPVVYAQGWKRASDGKAPTVKEAKDKKTDELTEKILPKLKE